MMAIIPNTKVVAVTWIISNAGKAERSVRDHHRERRAFEPGQCVFQHGFLHKPALTGCPGSAALGHEARHHQGKPAAAPCQRHADPKHKRQGRKQRGEERLVSALSAVPAALRRGRIVHASATVTATAKPMVTILQSRRRGR